MIIQVRGTSGSGKSTVMRKVMQGIAQCPWVSVFVEGRRQPLYYSHGGVIVLGHYEIACGGCDTIGSVPQVFAAMETLPPFRHLLCEGLLLSEDVIWTQKKALNGEDMRAVFLTTSEEECLRRVQQRQEEKGKPPADPARVRRKLTTRIGTIERARKRLEDFAVNITCRRVTSEQAPGLILAWLGYPLKVRLHADRENDDGPGTKLD